MRFIYQTRLLFCLFQIGVFTFINLTEACSADKSPPANVTFSDSATFAGYCAAFVPDSKYLALGETTTCWVACYWNCTTRSLSIFNLPRPLKSKQWLNRPNSSYRFYFISNGRRLEIEKIGTAQPVPIMSEVEIRTNSDSSSSIYGFPLGEAFAIPSNVTNLILEYKDDSSRLKPVELNMDLSSQNNIQPDLRIVWLRYAAISILSFCVGFFWTKKINKTH